MDIEECYRWGEIFAKPWDVLAEQMADRAKTLGLTQVKKENVVVWLRDSSEECRWVFVNDPSDIECIRAVFNDDENVQNPTCFVVVKQPDPSDFRGDVIFDIFRLNSQSFLWHFNRVFTGPKDQSD
ncbi:MAG: hypothetical protein ACYSTZ_08385 [Planctomycetota bacterium]|jgi:hypothetical protein